MTGSPLASPSKSKAVTVISPVSANSVTSLSNTAETAAATQIGIIADARIAPPSEDGAIPLNFLTLKSTKPTEKKKPAPPKDELPCVPF